MSGELANSSIMELASLRPYPEYKDSGLPWLAKVPAHWEIRRNGRLFIQRNQTGFSELPILEVSLRTGIRVRNFENSTRKQVMLDREKYKRAVKGDIAYNMMRMWQGDVGIAPTDGLISPAYVVVQPYPEVDSRYYAYLFRTEAYMNEVNKYSHGIVSDRNRLYWGEFKQMPSAFPPLDEQRVIAGFLDGHGRLVRNFIRAKRRLIELLNEQKHAIINQAVTRGLDPNVQIKPSGIDWLGEVPAHWEVKSLKQMGIIRLSGVDKHSIQGEIPVRLCNYTDVYNSNSISSNLKFMAATATEAEIAAFTLRMGDVLITKDSESWEDIAVPALVIENLDGVICGYHLALIRPEQSIIQSEYLFRTFSAPILLHQFNVAANGITRYGLSKHAIKNAVFPVPPLDEQQKVCLWIERQLQPIQKSIECTQREIDLIREYRERLITDVVTGKVDVRHLAAKLPAASETLEELAEVDTEESFIENEELIEEEEIIDADD